MTTPERFSDKMFEQQHPRVVDGTFTAKSQSAPEAALVAAPTVDGAFIERWNDFAGRPTIDPTVARLVAEELNETRNFSDQNIVDNIDAAYIAIHGYTPAVKVKYDFALTNLRRNGFGDSAEDVEAFVAGIIASRAGGAAPAPAIPSADGIIGFDDERVQAGEVLDRVEGADGVVYNRRRDGVVAEWPYHMRIQATRPISDEELHSLAGLVGYAYRARVGGEGIAEPQRDSAYSFTVFADTTKSRKRGGDLHPFEESLHAYVEEGTPVYTTDREGPIGSRRADPIEDLGIEIYYDNVSD